MRVDICSAANLDLESLVVSRAYHQEWNGDGEVQRQFDDVGWSDVTVTHPPSQNPSLPANYTIYNTVQEPRNRKSRYHQQLSDYPDHNYVIQRNNFVNSNNYNTYNSNNLFRSGYSNDSYYRRNRVLVPSVVDFASLSDNMNYTTRNHRRQHYRLISKPEDVVVESDDFNDGWYLPTKLEDERHVNSADEGFCSWNSSSEKICDSFTAMDYQDYHNQPSSCRATTMNATGGGVVMNRPYSNSRYTNNNDTVVSTTILDDTTVDDNLLIGIENDDTLWHTSPWSAPRKSTSTSSSSRNMTVVRDGNQVRGITKIDPSMSSPSDNSWCIDDQFSTNDSFEDYVDSTAIASNGNDRLSSSSVESHRVQKVSPYPRSAKVYGKYHVPLSLESSFRNVAGKRSSIPSASSDEGSFSFCNSQNQHLRQYLHLPRTKSDSLDNVSSSDETTSPGMIDVRSWAVPIHDDDSSASSSDRKSSCRQSDSNVGQIMRNRQLFDSGRHSRDIPDLVPKKVSPNVEIDSAYSKSLASCSSSSSSETDVNMVGRSFNNFSISSNKQQEILRLLQERRRYLEANIREVLPKCYPETKILNTSNRLGVSAAATTTSRKPGSGNTSFRHRRQHRRSEITPWDLQVAEGLVLERVRYDPNWRRRNRIFWNLDGEEQQPPTSDGSGRTYYNAKNFPKSVPDEISRSGIDEIGKQTDHVTVSSSVLSSSSSSSATSSCSTAIASCRDSDVNEKPTAAEEEASVIDNNPPSVTTDDSSKCELQQQQQQQNETDFNRNCTTLPLDVLPEHKPPEKTNDRTNIADDQIKDSCENKPPKSKTVSDLFGDFDVYNIETALPTIDWAKMEAHLTRAAKEDDWANIRKNDREEIRRRLALGSDIEDYYLGDKVTRKPSLSTRLQSGMNLQICFMNETVSDQDESLSSQCSANGDDEQQENSPLPSPTFRLSSWDDAKVRNGISSSSSTSSVNSNIATESSAPSPSPSTPLMDSSTPSTPNGSIATKAQRPSFFFAKQRSWRLRSKHKHDLEDDDTAKAAKEVEDFYTRQARLQAEARLALAQAKEMAKMQMHVEKQQKSKKSPIADIIGVPIPDNSYRISRQLLGNMNISQLQVVVNDLHTQIENLSEELVRLLMQRDDLNMEQDSMLVDIEDLTRYLGASSENISSQQLNNKSKILSK